MSSRKRPTDRLVKNSSRFEVLVTSAEEVMREEYAEGRRTVKLAGENSLVGERGVAPFAIGMVALLGGACGIALVLGWGIVAWIAAGLLAVTVAALFALQRPAVAEQVADRINSVQVPTVVAVAIESLRENPGRLQEAEAPVEAVEAAEALLAAAEERLTVLVYDGRHGDVDAVEAKEIVRLASKTLALATLVEQSPRDARKAAKQATRD